MHGKQVHPFFLQWDSPTVVEGVAGADSMTMAEEVRTLAYYAGCAYKEGVAKDVLME